MRTKRVKIASFVTQQAIEAANPVPIIGHVSTIAVLIYISKVKLAQFMQNLGKPRGLYNSPMHRFPPVIEP
ncbi:hypothetical protein BG74_04060 [Sodalis-like endosymbiont of Proechinophthirus fluctus]|nr:hypothetical protein BG74_04060 [Sodalis-like endosymbiont of Proechinophthirus fluctus]